MHIQFIGEQRLNLPAIDTIVMTVWAQRESGEELQERERPGIWDQEEQKKTEVDGDMPRFPEGKVYLQQGR